MSLRKITVQMFLAITVLTACSPLTDNAATPELTPETAAPTPTSSPAAGLTPPAATAGETGVPDPLPTADAEAHPLAGLVYRTVEGVWIVEKNGESTWLVDSPYTAVSPDGRLVAYAYGDPEDIYLMDRETGETSNLTNTPDRMERGPKFWTERPEVLAFSSASLDEGMFGGGHPTLVNRDGSNYQVLDPTGGGEFSLSPDGDHIAFGCCGPTATLYSLSSGPSVFDPSEFGQPVEAMLLPSFAPDNQQLAWAVNSGSLLGVSLFDLAQGSSKLLHPYQPVGGSEFFGELVWSPNSEWLVYVNTNELPEMGRKPTLWALQPDTGGDEIFLGEGYRPAWKPDGTKLAYTTSGTEGTDWTIWLIDPHTWMNPEPAPFKGEVYGWVTP